MFIYKNPLTLLFAFLLLMASLTASFSIEIHADSCSAKKISRSTYQTDTESSDNDEYSNEPLRAIDLEAYSQKEKEGDLTRIIDGYRRVAYETDSECTDDDEFEDSIMPLQAIDLERDYQAFKSNLLEFNQDFTEEKPDDLIAELNVKYATAQSYSSRQIEKDLPLVNIIKHLRKSVQFFEENKIQIEQEGGLISLKKIKRINMIHKNIYKEVLKSFEKYSSEKYFSLVWYYDDMNYLSAKYDVQPAVWTWYGSLLMGVYSPQFTEILRLAALASA